MSMILAVRRISRYGIGTGVFVSDGPVEGFDQVLHAGPQVEVLCQKTAQVRSQVPEVLLREYHRRNELLGITLERGAAQLDQRFVILIEDETVLCAIDAKLMERGTHL